MIALKILHFLLWCMAGVTALFAVMLIVGLIVGYVFDKKTRKQ